MIAYGFPILVLLERVRMHNNFLAINMGMLEENIAP